MISSLRGNKSLVKKKGFFLLRNEYLKAADSQRLDLKKATPQQLKAIRKKMIADNKREFRNKILALFLSVVGGPVVLWLIIYIGRWWFNDI